MSIDLGTTPDGLPVVATDLELRQVGGGLTKPLRVDPQTFEQGTRVIVSYEAVVRSVRFDPIDNNEPHGEQARVHIAYPETAIVQRADKAGPIKTDLDSMREQIQRVEEAEKGIMRLATDEELHAAHEAGEHAGGLVDGCADCEHETDLENKEHTDEVAAKRGSRSTRK